MPCFVSEVLVGTFGEKLANFARGQTPAVDLSCTAISLRIGMSLGVRLVICGAR